MSRVKILLDADVIIHFSKGGFLSILPDIFPTYDYVVLDKVYQEIREPIKSQLDNQIHILGKLEILQYSPKGEELKEYALLSKDKGKGESACLAYCRFNPNIIGSSNLSDIKSYCEQYQIT
jgi:predicted nucleic acid-binding protein